MKTITCDKTGIILSVNENGEVFKDNRKLSSWLNANGYPYIQTYKAINGKSIRRSHQIHILLATLYIPNPNNKPCVNHKDGNKANYSLDNLEWVTHSENMIHAVAIGLHTNCTKKGENHNCAKHTFEEVQEIRRLYKTGKYSMRALAKAFNTGSGMISDVVNNKRRVES